MQKYAREKENTDRLIREAYWNVRLIAYQLLHGVYSNLTFASATVDAEGLVTVVFHIAQPAELRLAALERSQAEQDDAIAELLGGEE